MTRKKVKLALISDDMARRISYNRRKKNIIKKVRELTTLCGTQACAIISSPFDSTPEIWPDMEGVKQVTARYQNTSAKNLNMAMNQESFAVHMSSKAQEKLSKLRQQIREKELTMTMFNCMRDETLMKSLTVKDANDLGMQIEKMKKEVDDQIATFT